MDNTVISLLKNILNDKSVLINEPMKNHTSFRIGGNADFLVLPENLEQIKETVSVLKKNSVRYTVIGNGSNLLVDDNGIEGVVIKLSKNFSYVDVTDNIVTAQSGVLLSRLANIALEKSLSGLEFASGIPGTLGGAIVMNAGAYGGEMKDVVRKTVYMNTDGDICTVTDDEHGFGYRKSNFVQGDIILQSTLTMSQGSKENIKEKMDEFNMRRRTKQPLEFPSAGSAFKRPEGYYAGKLIEDAGLRGYKIGGASVSDKHCGFIVSDGTATCSDVLSLVEYIKNEVFNKFSVELESEIRYVK